MDVNVRRKKQKHKKLVCVPNYWVETGTKVSVMTRLFGVFDRNIEIIEQQMLFESSQCLFDRVKTIN